jgi:hypothetical protein
VRVPGQKEQKVQTDYVDVSAKGVKAPIQLKKPILLPIYGSVLESRISVDLFKSNTFKTVKIGTFEVSFLNGHELLVPSSTVLVQLDFKLDDAFKRSNP